MRTKTAFDRLLGGSIQQQQHNDDNSNSDEEEQNNCLIKGKRDLLFVLSNCANNFFELLEFTVDGRAVMLSCGGGGGLEGGEDTTTDMTMEDVSLRSTVATLEHFILDVKRVDSAIGGEVGLYSRSVCVIVSDITSLSSCYLSRLLASILTGLLPHLQPLLYPPNSCTTIYHLYFSKMCS